MIYTRSYPHYSNNDPIHWSGCHITNPLSKASVSRRPRYHVRLLVCLCVWWSSSVNDDVIFRYVLTGRCYLCLSLALTSLDNIIDAYPQSHSITCSVVIWLHYAFLLHCCQFDSRSKCFRFINPASSSNICSEPSKKKECFLNCLAQLPPRPS